MRPHAGLVATIAGLLATLPVGGAAPRFFPDDPVAVLRDTQDASGVTPFEVDPDFDSVENMFGQPGDAVRNVRALDVNSIDEVPDSSWYTNRAGTLTPAAVARGPNTGDGPAHGAWTVISAKTSGVMPGLVVRDSAGVDWFIKFDPIGHRGMASGAEVVSTRLLWALGFHVPENHVAHVRAEDLVVGAKTTIRTHNRKRAMRQDDIATVLSRAARGADGTYRVLASRRLEGKPLGPFRFHGIRPDDPNDYVRHEHRRVLRGYGTWAAWLNHVDAKSTNTLDVLVREDGRSVVRHCLLDFGSTLGSAGVTPREAFEGAEYLFDGRSAWTSALGFGFPIESWRVRTQIESAEVGALPDSTNWDPDDWKPRLPNAAFLRARTDDRFWAAARLQALTPDLIAAAVDAARYEDEASREAVITFLVQRRHAILRRSLNAINPVVNPRLDAAGRLTFANAAVDADVGHVPAGYRTVWTWFDNATGATTPIGEQRSPSTEAGAPQPLAPEPGRFVRIAISAIGSAEPAWTAPVYAYFRGTGNGWGLVGFERMPEGNPATPLRSTRASAPAVARQAPRAPAESAGR
jgi:hypothetical protein